MSTTLAALVRVESGGNSNAVSLNRPDRLACRGLKPANLITRQPTCAAEAIALLL